MLVQQRLTKDYLTGQSSRNSTGTADNVDVMHESIPGVTIPPAPPPREFARYTVHGGRELAFHICARAPGIGGPRGFDKCLPTIPPTNFKAAKPSFRHACGRVHRILRPRRQGGVKFIVRISENSTPVPCKFKYNY
jgi:hypothetical protein